ncbi:hypothetical protein KCP70_14310 [Salmonella enterica subsp. enterica]|nr:hypothetical protein KCP70_14310 [Salmonella enterica subsp. enterica]
MVVLITGSSYLMNKGRRGRTTKTGTRKKSMVDRVKSQPTNRLRLNSRYGAILQTVIYSLSLLAALLVPVCLWDRVERRSRRTVDHFLCI